MMEQIIMIILLKNLYKIKTMKFLTITNDKAGLEKVLFFAKLFPEYSVIQAIEEAFIKINC